MVGEGQNLRRADSNENRTLAERCITWGNDGPPMMPVGYNANLDILQGPGYLVVRNEMIHGARRWIPIDAAKPHVGEKIRQWNGDSRGHWDGNTLVVETTNFNEKVRFRNSTRALKVTERFTRVDADTVDYTFTVEDPNTWTRPWTANVPLRKVPGPIYEHAAATKATTACRTSCARSAWKTRRTRPAASSPCSAADRDASLDDAHQHADHGQHEEDVDEARRSTTQGGPISTGRTARQ